MGKEMSKSGEDRRVSSVPNENFLMEEDIQKYLKFICKNKLGEKALEILKIASYFTSSIIEKDIFSSLTSNEQELKETLQLLEKHSLIELFWETGVFSVDEKVSEKVRSFLFENKQESVLKSAFELFSKSPGSEEMVVHINSVVSFAKKYPDLLEEHSPELITILSALIISDDFAEAFLLGSETFEVLKETLGEYHLQTLKIQKKLAELSFLCDNVDRALTLATELYEKESKVIGNKTCSPTLELIAKLKLKVEKKPESERQLRELVFGQVPVSETKNNSVLDVWDKYGVMLVGLDLLDEALEIFKDILKKRLEILDPDDDDIDDVNGSIAAVYFTQKEFDKGLEVAEKIYERRKARYGEFSMKTISSYSMMGQAYLDKEMNDKALSVFECVREKVRAVAGKSSLYYRTLAHLGKIYFILDDFGKSYEINSELYEKRKEDSGDKDDMCLSLKQNMLSCLIGQGKTKEASELYSEGLTWCLETFGVISSKTLKWCTFLESKGLTYTYCQILTD